MLLYRKTYRNKISAKPLSENLGISQNLLSKIPYKKKRIKALQYARAVGSFTIEAAFILPLFLFAAVMILGLFQLILAEIYVTGGMQYASRTLAVACCLQEDMSNVKMQAEARLLFLSYIKQHGYETDCITRGWMGISFQQSDVSGDYVELRASYRVKLPISFWKLKELPVSQCVKCKKWTGKQETLASKTDDDYVYITETGVAYHKDAGCHYLDLSVRSIAVTQIKTVRSKDGRIYRRCSCCKSGQSVVYITDYGNQYHGSLFCSDLKRTVYRVSKEKAGTRHPCAKCYRDQ